MDADAKRLGEGGRLNADTYGQGEERVKIGKILLTSFMDGPLRVHTPSFCRRSILSIIDVDTDDNFSTDNYPLKSKF